MMRALERFYRVLLYLYPASFRNEYGRALTATFVARLRDMSGPARPLLGALAAVGDVVPNAIAAHWEILRHDVRYAGRSLRASPGFTLTAILVIALGVGANTAAFSLADFVLLRPLPFHEPDRLVDLWESTPGYPHMEFSPANYRDMKAMTHSFAAMGAYSDRTMNLVGTGEPRHLTVGIMTPHAMPVLGVPPLLGRAITPEDSTNEQVVVLSYGLWQSQFGGDAGIVGRAVRLDGEPYSVIGVMPAAFAFPTREIDAWVPFLLREAFFADRSDNFLSVVARLRPGVTTEQAATDGAVHPAARVCESREPPARAVRASKPRAGGSRGAWRRTRAHRQAARHREHGAGAVRRHCGRGDRRGRGAGARAPGARLASGEWPAVSGPAGTARSRGTRSLDRTDVRSRAGHRRGAEQGARRPSRRSSWRRADAATSRGPRDDRGRRLRRAPRVVGTPHSGGPSDPGD
jgi:MacB-like protein